MTRKWMLWYCDDTAWHKAWIIPNTWHNARSYALFLCRKRTVRTRILPVEVTPDGPM